MTLKPTSHAYGREFQLRQAEKYRHRATNHWRQRIDLARNLVERFGLPRLEGKNANDIVVADVGCSIGTFAIEFAKLGYRAFGIDFDPSALTIAAELAREEGVAPEFFCGDVSNWSADHPPIDLAICFDIFEHLHDDELGAFLSAIRQQLSRGGSLVFHTYPTEYDHVFWSRSFVGAPLLPLRHLPAPAFARVTKAYAALIDAALVVTQGETRRERIRLEGHCNPTTPTRLREILERAGFDVVHLETANLYGEQSALGARFRDQPITHRNLFGVAIPSSSFDAPR
jgi:2-polyprenyl-3-methyl-5-hydroxy-6-metoxy-1,4-benzoquinol methylase